MNNEFVILNTEDFFLFDEEMVERLKIIAFQNPRKCARVCLHKDNDDLLHQMIIVHCKGAYVRPHRHPVKTVSYHMIEGELLFIVFDDSGNVVKRVVLNEKGAGKYFGFRIEKNMWYLVVPVTGFVVFHEILNGPFTGYNDSEFPEWAPDESDIQGIDRFFNCLGL